MVKYQSTFQYQNQSYNFSTLVDRPNCTYLYHYTIFVKFIYDPFLKPRAYDSQKTRNKKQNGLAYSRFIICVTPKQTKKHCLIRESCFSGTYAKQPINNIGVSTLDLVPIQITFIRIKLVRIGYILRPHMNRIT